MNSQDENREHEDVGAENEQSEAKDALPGKPVDDKDAELGDTDQHSSSNA